MSSVISECDSDEEVFWGPVTAREIELLWRHRKRLQKEEERSKLVHKSAEEFINESTDSGNQSDLRGSSIAGPLQEVPSLHDFSTFCEKEINLEGNIHCIKKTNSELKNDSYINESTLPLSEDNILHSYHREIEGVQYSGNHFSNEIRFENTEIAIMKNSEDVMKLNHSFDQDVNIVTTLKVNDNLAEQSEDAIIIEATPVKQEFSSSTCDTDTNVPSLPITEGNSSELNKINELVTILDKISVMPKKTNEMAISTLPTGELEAGDTMLAVCSDHTINGQNNTVNISYEKKDSNNLCQQTENINLSHENVMHEIDTKNQEEFVMSSEVSLNEQIKLKDAINNGDDSSDDELFVSPNKEEDKFSSSLIIQRVPLNKDNLISSDHSPPLKNKENENPYGGSSKNIKSKVPITNPKQLSSKKPILKPARLENFSSLNDATWASGLKRKKIPQPKKPDYMVSPAKLNNILKNHGQLSAQINKTPVVKTVTKPKINPSVSRPKLETPKSMLFSSRKNQFEYIKSPISEYIRTGGVISPAKSLPGLHTPNKIPVPITTKEMSVQKLAPKFYSSAEKLIIKPGPSSSIPTLQGKKGKALLFPKIFKHQGRVVDGKNPEQISVVTPRAVRTTNLQEASFAILPQSPKQLNISVLEEQ